LVGAVTALRELPVAECKQGIRRLVPEYAPFGE
jgi:hypothetical protein